MLLGVTGCLGGYPVRPEVAPTPTFDPVQFFSGHTVGEGTLDVRFASKRSLRVESTGATQADGQFRLDQTITFDDGKIEKRTWLLRRVDDTHYSASLSDAKGEVIAESSGNRFHLRYLLRQPAVYVDQSLYLQPDGHSVLNQLQVSVLGVPWARLSETIRRVDVRSREAGRA
ncbi:MAG: DUF3833 family protein [bacterium]